MFSQKFNLTKLSFSKRYFLLPLVLIVFFILFYLVYNDIKTKTINKFNNEQLIIAQAASQGITSFFQNYQSNLTFLSKNKLIIDFNDDTKVLMESFYNNHKNFIEAVTRVDANGKILYTYPYLKSIIGESISYQKHVRQVLTTQQPVISDVFMSVQGYLAVALHVPVFKGKELKGSLAVLIQIDKLGKMYFEKIKIRETYSTWLLSENGIEIFCKIKGHIGKSLLEISNNNPSATELMEKLKKENKGATKSIHPEGGVDGQTKYLEKHIAFYRVPLGSTYWIINISYTEEDVYAELTSFRNRLIGIFSFLFIVMAYYFYSLAKVRTVLKEETKRKETEKILNENEEIFRRFMEHSPIYVFFKDENIRSLRLSKNYETMLGKPIAELLGKNMHDLFPTELASSIVEDDKRILNEGKEITVEEELNGRFYSTIKFPIIRDGKPRYLAGYTIDITERKRSEELLEQANLVVENSQAVLFRWRAEKNWPVIFVSQNVVQFGYKPEELLNGSILFASMVHPEDLERVSHEVGSNTKLGIERFQHEYRILRKDGTICWVDDRTVVERNTKGQVTHYQGVIVDISERKKAEEVILQRNEQLKALSQASQEINKKLEISSVLNSLVAFAMKVTNSESGAAGLFINGKIVFTDYNDRGNILPIDYKFDAGYGVPGWIIETKKPYISNDAEHDEHVAQEIQKTLGFYNLVDCPILNKEGELLGCFEIHNTKDKRLYDNADIELLQGLAANAAIAMENARLYEEIKNNNLQLEHTVSERTSELQAVNRELESFSYSVSHDLRAPLRAIDGFSKIIVEDHGSKLGDEGERLLNVIRTNAQKMDQLIIDLLSLSRVGRLEIDFLHIDMTKLVSSIYDEMASQDIKKKFSFRVSKLPDVIGSISLIKQVWSNLISNAIKFTLPNDVRTIEIGSYKENNKAIFFVKDTGVGFNPEYKAKLFNIFQRLHKIDEFEGTGVGLAIVKRIVSRHGGEVWAEGSINNGATFYFSMPDKDQVNYVKGKKDF